ncbi:MAG: hypothetical protein R3C00_12505 [Hyphomonas sp.]
MTSAKDDPVHRPHSVGGAALHPARYAGQTIVVKYGGHAMVDEELAAMFAAMWCC